MIFKNHRLSTIITLLLTGSIFFKWFEGLLMIDAIYLSHMSLTSIGLGDVYPKTYIGRIFGNILFNIIALKISINL